MLSMSEILYVFEKEHVCTLTTSLLLHTSSPYVFLHFEFNRQRVCHWRSWVYFKWK